MMSPPGLIPGGRNNIDSIHAAYGIKSLCKRHIPGVVSLIGSKPKTDHKWFLSLPCTLKQIAKCQHDVRFLIGDG